MDTVKCLFAFDYQSETACKRANIQAMTILYAVDFVHMHVKCGVSKNILPQILNFFKTKNHTHAESFHYFKNTSTSNTLLARESQGPCPTTPCSRTHD